jgi:phosphogluconate dehydratase
MAVHERIAEVTARIAQRSARTRRIYLERCARAGQRDNPRSGIGCGNIAHVVAGCAGAEKAAVADAAVPHIGIVTAYNDMLSAHVPYANYPAQLKEYIARVGATAQVAGGVPAMCDGVTQGRPGMELGLFSREVIALSTAVALSHDVFDGVLLLGICDKIVPGLLIGALSFGHLPVLFVPAGPMTAGLPNAEKARVRQEYAAGTVGRDGLLAAEMASYHSPGTCTFFGTANSNQLVMEVMGLQLPGSSFVNPDTPLRAAFNQAAARTIVSCTKSRGGHRPLGELLDERVLVNGIVALLASGGSTNLTLHLPVIAAAAGMRLSWQDFSDLAEVVPLLARIYPNGLADINQFAEAGGVSLLVRELAGAGLLHGDVLTMAEDGSFAAYTAVPALDGCQLYWRPGPETSGDYSVLRGCAEPFQHSSGIKVLHGNLGEAVIKTSAVKPEYWQLEAPALLFDSQETFLAAFAAGALERDFIAVIRFQGPRANGMPELHKLIPSLGLLMDQGHRVALVTDGRMSGASGKVPAAIHLTPEAAEGGPLARLRDGDVIRIDARAGTLTALVDAAEFAARPPVAHARGDEANDRGRILFAGFRAQIGGAATGATIFGNLLDSE